MRGNVAGNFLFDLLRLAGLPWVWDLLIERVLRWDQYDARLRNKWLRTYGPDALLDLYLSISFPRAFFMAYLATRFAMLCDGYVRVWWRKGFVG